MFKWFWTIFSLGAPDLQRINDLKVRRDLGHWASMPANFFWDISMRFLSWECWDFGRRHDHFQRFPKKSEVFQRSPKSSEDVRSLPKAKLSSPSLRTRINASSLPVPFTSKIRDREEGIVIYSFYTWFSFLTWVLHGQQLTFFNQAWEIGPQAWAGVRSKFSTRRRESWQVCQPGQPGSCEEAAWHNEIK